MWQGCSPLSLFTDYAKISNAHRSIPAERSCHAAGKQTFLSGKGDGKQVHNVSNAQHHQNLLFWSYVPLLYMGTLHISMLDWSIYRLHVGTANNSMARGNTSTTWESCGKGFAFINIIRQYLHTITYTSEPINVNINIFKTQYVKRMSHINMFCKRGIIYWTKWRLCCKATEEINSSSVLSYSLHFLGASHHSALIKEDVFQHGQDNVALLHPETSK